MVGKRSGSGAPMIDTFGDGVNTAPAAAARALAPDETSVISRRYPWAGGRINRTLADGVCSDGPPNDRVAPVAIERPATSMESPGSDRTTTTGEDT
jgi:hypothetical protein